MSLNLSTILRESAQRYPAKTAIVLGETKLTYKTVHEYAQRFAGALAKLGIRRGQHVALLLPNVPHFTIAYFGCHYAGRVRSRRSSTLTRPSRRWRSSGSRTRATARKSRSSRR